MGSFSSMVNRIGKNPTVEGENLFSIHKLLQSRRNQSFSSSSFSSAPWYSFDSSSIDSSLNPIASLQFSRIPFSWEQFPGIPKNSTHSRSSKIRDSSLISLPLPPSANSKKLNLETIFAMDKKKIKKSHESIKRDPFVVALKKCSKDQKKGSRALNDRIGFIESYTSCKRSCSVSESVVLLPRPIQMNYHR